MKYQETARKLKELLGLRWEPVAVRLMRPDEDLPPNVIEANVPLRHCQSIMLARRGYCIYMPPRSHACPDGAGIMGLVEMSSKLRSGELYLLFKKLPDLETASKVISSRPEFPAGSYKATLLAPLGEATFEPDVVIFTLWPEQAMWLCCSQTYTTGRRQVFHSSGFNSACADLVVQPMQSGETNISFGCYGTRASSEIDDFELFFSTPLALLDDLVLALEKLSSKSIPEARRKIYLHPVLDKVGMKADDGIDNRIAISLTIDSARCRGEGLCVDFCPESVLEMHEEDGRNVAAVVRPEACVACYTCVRQCPENIIQLKYGRSSL